MKEIILAKEIGSNLITRHSLDRLFSKLKKYKSKELIIDFDNIKFVSRSGADEYIKLKNIIRKNIKEINQSDDVKKMFEIVSNTKDIRMYDKMMPVRISVI